MFIQKHQSILIQQSECAPIEKHEWVRSAKHLDFIRTLRCLVLGCGQPAEPHHLTYGTGEPKGMKIKASDCFCVNLCHAHHMQLHATGEKSWWRRLTLDPHELAVLLWAQTQASLGQRPRAISSVVAA